MVGVGLELKITACLGTMELYSIPRLREHAVKFAQRFLEQFGQRTPGILSCFDRVIFKGYLPFFRFIKELRARGCKMWKCWFDQGLYHDL